MKRVFSSRSKALVVPFSFALALTLAIGSPITSHADVKSLWNPMHWLNSDQVTDSAATDARKKADQAQQAADQAMQDAQKALERAAEARHQAEALEKTPHGAKKPVIVAPEEIQASTDTTQSSTSSSNTSEKPAQTVYQAPTQSGPDGINQAFSSAAPKKEAWNPMNWFHKDPDKATGLEDGLPLETPVQAVSTPQPEAVQKTETPAETATEKTQEAAPTKAHGSWNLKNLFTKPARTENVEAAPAHNTVDASTKTEPQAEAKPEPQAEPKTEAPVEAKAPKTEAPAETATTKTEAEAKTGKADETSSANANSKGGWNLLNLLSKPSIPTNSQGIIQQTKASADKAPQPAAEHDQSIKTKAALIETERGNIAIELYPDQAPATVANFVKLINEGFYNRFNMKFHRVVPGFVVQTGDPTGTGAGGSKERIPLEAKNKLSHNTKGIVAMARGADPNSATSQFYITLAPQTSLDGKYAVFGRVISGIDVVSKIEKDDMLYGIRLVDLSTVVRDVQPEKKKFFSSLF